MGSRKIDFLFYTPDILQTCVLSEIESQHCVKVLRHNTADYIYVTDGNGGMYYCKIIEAHHKKCKVDIINKTLEFNKPNRQISIAICPTKNADRMEYFLEKAVEIGVSNVYFLKSQNTVAKRINLERMEKISISAMKQSIKAYKTNVYEMQDFESFIGLENRFPQKLIANLNVDAKPIVSQKIDSEVLIMIGPEGDFSKNELEIAQKFGFINVSLGQNRLRTETAAIVALSIINLNNL